MGHILTVMSCLERIEKVQREGKQLKFNSGLRWNYMYYTCRQKWNVCTCYLSTCKQQQYYYITIVTM